VFWVCGLWLVASLVLGVYLNLPMTFWTLIRRSFRFHARAHLGAGLGAAIGSAALTGALLVGDSVRETLRQRALQRLANASFALAPVDRLFTLDLEPYPRSEAGGQRSEASLFRSPTSEPSRSTIWRGTPGVARDRFPAFRQCPRKPHSSLWGWR